MLDRKPDRPLSESEIAQRRDDAIRRALNTPPKLHSEMVGKSGRDPRPSKPKTGRKPPG